MDRSFFILVDGPWLIGAEPHAKRFATGGLCAIGPSAAHLADGCNLLVKYNDLLAGTLVADGDARIQSIKEMLYVRSSGLCAMLAQYDLEEHVVALFFEGTETEARCVVDVWARSRLEELEQANPTLRLAAFDLPPASATLVDAQHLVATFYRAAATREPDLFALHASRFLDAPHIITALFSHVFSIRTEDNIRFPIQVKKIAEQLRTMLTSGDLLPRIHAMKKSHVELWAEAEGERFGFLDGGIARIAALPGRAPMALRVGVYSVIPGTEDPERREQWRMRPYVLGDLIDRKRPTAEHPDTRRMHEAARYTLEPLTALVHLREFADTRLMLLHGPLVNQFLQYDEGEPNHVPFLDPEFLLKVGIERASVVEVLRHLPTDARNEPMWNQFMSIYAYVMRQIDEAATPIAGVVERPTGRAVTMAVLNELATRGTVLASYVKKVQSILEQYDITDDFLFGCVLREGEYVTPVRIQKNHPHRARERWQPIVKQYPSVSAMLLKSEDTNFPFRVELNAAAAADHSFLARFLYHTARLLPRYAFPVGLDIVDKYAKVPDWISRGISAQLSASVLRRAMQTGDAHVVAQIRLLLAQGPRDFFYRPSATTL